MKKYKNQILVGGKVVKAEATEIFDVVNPATEEVITTMADCGPADVDAAVSAAKAAQVEWKKVPSRERGKLLLRAADRLQGHAKELTKLMVHETGKAIRTESRVETAIFTDVLEYYGGLGGELKGTTVPFHPEMLSYTVREPLGVIGAIIPWNVPLMLMAFKVAPALVAGNSVVVKSSEYAPLAVLRAAEIMNEVLPPGVFNLISGHGKTGEVLVKHPTIKKVTFTGSVATGRSVYKNAAEKLIPVTLELGGKNPMVICADADLDRAIEGAFTGMRFTRQGQSCSAASRIFVHESLYDEFLRRFKERLEALVIGDPMSEKTDVGAVISKTQYDKIRSFLNLASEEPGVEMHVCNQEHKGKGFFLQPTILTNVSHRSRLAQEEIFGPVTCLFKWKTLDEAIEMANDTSFGLTATIWTSDLKTALRATEEIDAGLVQVNQNLVVQAGIPYGGHKSSGIGEEASLEAMVEHFMKKKMIMINRL